MDCNEIKTELICCLLPKKMYEDYENFLALGFKFEETTVHEQLYKATLPMGWTITQEHTGRFYVYDDKNRRRVSGEASQMYIGMGLERRYDIREDYDKEKESFVISIVDHDESVLFTTTGKCKVRLVRGENGFERTDEYKAIIAEYKAYFEENFPDWKNPSKYWD